MIDHDLLLSNETMNEEFNLWNERESKYEQRDSYEENYSDKRDIDFVDE